MSSPSDTIHAVSRGRVLVSLGTLVLTGAGCLATRPYVRTEVQKSDERTQQQLQVVDHRLGTVERDLAEERAQRVKLEGDIDNVRTQVTETAKQADETRERVARVEGTARDAQHAPTDVAPAKTPVPVARGPETLMVYFKSADWLLDKTALLALEWALSRLRENPALIVKLEGHADTVGSAAQNMKLSQRRADEVWRFLVMNGIKRNRIEASAVGEAQPIASNESGAGRGQNRRVGVTLLPSGSTPGLSASGGPGTSRSPRP
jgi:outer membrane protein OmpA-like peptidoglycan-associated protein